MRGVACPILWGGRTIGKEGVLALHHPNGGEKKKRRSRHESFLLRVGGGGEKKALRPFRSPTRESYNLLLGGRGGRKRGRKTTQQLIIYSNTRDPPMGSRSAASWGEKFKK